jgi:hypothetical protein
MAVMKQIAAIKSMNLSQSNLAKNVPVTPTIPKSVLNDELSANDLLTSTKAVEEATSSNVVDPPSLPDHDLPPSPLARAGD